MPLAFVTIYSHLI